CWRGAIAAVEASAASFHPSNAAMATGPRSTGSPSNSLTCISVVRRVPERPGLSAGPVSTGMAVGALFRPANLYGVANRFLDNLRDRVLVADGAMGTMLHAAEPTVDDYQGH